MTRLISTIIAISLLTTSSALADCPPSLRLNVGDVVKDCPRIGLNLDTDLKVRQDLIEGDYNKKLVDEQQKLIDMKDLRIKESDQKADLYKADALREREYADKVRSSSDTKFWVGLGVGILLTLGGAWAVKQVAR